MKPLVVVENVRRWPLELPDAVVVSARDYLVDPEYGERRGVAVFNLCRHYGYQRLGYYVSLLAAARGHKPMPSVATMQALRLAPVLRTVSDDLDALMQRSLRALKSSKFELSVYFGANLAKRYEQLSRALFNQFPAPFLRATFQCEDRWKLQNLRAIATSEIPDAHHDFVMEQARQYFAKPGRRPRTRRRYRYDLAILWAPEAVDSPSDQGAIRRFIRAAQRMDIDADVIGVDDYGRIAEYDALFIRETTYVNHHTFRFAQRAAAEGLVVVDDPESIIRCTNKVYQAELFARRNVRSPDTLVVHEGNLSQVEAAIGLPCVLKRPDSSFSQGVVRVDAPEELRAQLQEFLRHSELVIAQAYIPSEFDWRIGILDRRPLFAAKYHMASGHWQIIDGEGGRRRYGRVEAAPLEAVPAAALKLAARAAGLIGNGFYGVDIKHIDRRFLVMEVNDNPNVDAGCEDAVLKDQLYDTIAQWFRDRLDARGTAPNSK